MCSRSIQLKTSVRTQKILCKFRLAVGYIHSIEFLGHPFIHISLILYLSYCRGITMCLFKNIFIVVKFVIQNTNF